MDSNKKKSVPNPREGASLLSILTFRWILGTFLTGYKRDLDESDLYSPLDGDSSQLLGNKISRLWEKELERTKNTTKKETPSLLRVLARIFGREVLVYGLFISFMELVKTMQPLFLINLLSCFREGCRTHSWEIYYWGMGIVLTAFFEAFIIAITGQGLLYVGTKVGVACCSLVYRKVLKITRVEAEGKTSIGQITNLLSNDVSRLDYCVLYLPYLWITPVQTVVISYLMYREVGLAVFAGIGILILFVSIHGWYGKLTSRFATKISQRMDERLRLTNEILNGIKVIKMYAWEKPFIELVDKARRKEVHATRNSMIISEIIQSFKDYLPRICLLATVVVYIFLGHNIDAAKVYLLTAYYYVLRVSFFRAVYMNAKYCAQSLVSLKRITKLLLFDEINEESLASRSDENLKKAGISISLNNVTAKWSPDSAIESLKGISLMVNRGSLTAVAGQVGAGKTTLLQAILGEIPSLSGEVTVNGKVSYASQEPWLFASSIKQNILFGAPMDRRRYDRVIEVCQLRRDFQQLPYGENTLAGDRGMNLSGGQRARVNLARAVYHRADVYLMDDPLSAVDSRVARAIFEDCIKTFLRGKTVVMVTHQQRYLKHVDKIVVVGGGAVLVDGSYESLLRSNVDLKSVLKHEEKSDEISGVSLEGNGDQVESGGLNDVEEAGPTERKAVGSVSWEVYGKYFRATGNYFLVVLVLLTSSICQISRSGADYFITNWVNVEERSGNLSTINGAGLLRTREWYIGVYGLIIVASVLFSLVRCYAFWYTCMRISKNLHAMIFSKVIKAKMAFFNAYPIGHAMNSVTGFMATVQFLVKNLFRNLPSTKKFSKDIEIIDNDITETLFDVLQTALLTFAIVAIVASVNPWSLVPALVIIVIAYFITSFYMKTSRSIKRLQRTTRSPVFNHLNASVHGLATIRALKAQETLTHEFDDHQDLHTSACFLFIAGIRGFELYIDILCALFTGLVIYTLLLITDTALIGDAGLVITQCMLMIGGVRWGARQMTELENQMTSVERILEYERLEQEPLLPAERPSGRNQPEDESLLEESKVKRAPEHWPRQGRIVFKDVSLRYGRQDQPALRNISFAIEPREVVGIVGRTGAGKSSVINALLRLADCEGEICIDDVDTGKVALHDLRSGISVIPQEAVLFAGTLRANLDPLQRYSDLALCQALEDVDMRFAVESGGGLNAKVAEGGSNFSVGQRQLICLARAIVRNNRILVLDEATANVDPNTDQLIQKTIRERFTDCTVLIIAHRLNSIMDSNKVIVMDAGEVVEFDHPYKLLQRGSGAFYKMVRETGESSAESLFQIAKLSYEKLPRQYIIK